MDSILTDLEALLNALSAGAQYKIFCAFIAFPFAAAAIEALYNVFRGEKTTFAYKFLSVICVSAAILSAAFEYDVRGEVFSSITAVVLYAALSFYVCVFLYAFLVFVNYVLVYELKTGGALKKPCDKAKPAAKNAVKGKVKESVETPATNTYGAFGADGLFSGYLNVKYVKYLIDKLKNYDISVSERKEAEDFEVYLMNFACRQPTETEREELSPKLNALIKTLAKYNAV